MRIKSLFIALALLGSGAVQAEGNVDAGRQKAETCMGCHAVDGYFNVYPSYHVPKLGGQHAQYISDALKAYRSGDRKHDTMRANAGNLSDQDIADIAAFFASETAPSSANPPQDETLVTMGKAKSESCAACHGADGNSTVPNFPILAGQHPSYIANSLKSYVDGRRNNAIMSGQANGLSDEDIEALAAYYASQEGLQSIDMPNFQ